MKRDAEREKATQDQESEELRWSHVLAQVNEEYRVEGPWWRRLGIFAAWAGGIAGATAVVVTLLVLIVDLFSSKRLFSALNVSNWIFWASALLMGVGLLSPVAGEVQSLPGQQTGSKDEEKKRKKDKDREKKKDKDVKKARRRIQRVYNPWRWRFWAAALLAFGISILVGLGA